MKSLAPTPVPDASCSALTRHPYSLSLLGRTGPSVFDLTPSLYRERPSSVTVLGKKITPDAAVTINIQSQFSPRPVSFEPTKAKQHFNKTKPIKNLSDKPKTTRARSAISPKLLGKIKLYSQTGGPSRGTIRSPDSKPSKKPPVPKAPRRSDKSKEPRKTTVPILHIEEVARPSNRESPHIGRIPKIDDIVQLTLRKSLEEKQRDEELKSLRKKEEQHKRQLLKQHNLQIRKENQRFQGAQFKPRTPWGTDERRIFGKTDGKTLKEARLERELKLLNRNRTKSSDKDRIGLEALNEIKAELHSKKRSQSAIDVHEQFQSGRTSTKEVRMPDPEVLEFMKQKRLEMKEYYERKCVSQMALESKRLTQLKDLDIRTKVAVKRPKKLKKRRKRVTKKIQILDELYDQSSNPELSEDIEVIGIMNRLRGNANEPARSDREGRESRVFGFRHQEPSTTEQRAVQRNASQIYQLSKPSEELLLPRVNITMPSVKLKEDTTSVNLEEIKRSNESESSSFRKIAGLIEPSEDSSLHLDLSEKQQSSEVSRRKEDIKAKLADLRRRAESVKCKVSGVTNETPAYSQFDLSGISLNLPLIGHSAFEQMLQVEAAVKIQSYIRRFLAVLKCERLRAEMTSEDLSGVDFSQSLYGNQDGKLDFKQSKFSDRLRIGVRSDLYLEENSERDLLKSSRSHDSSEIEVYSAGSSQADNRRPITDPLSRPNATYSGFVEEFEDFDTSRQLPSTPGDSDFSGSELEGEGVLDDLLQELQEIKQREVELEAIIGQHQIRQQPEKAKPTPPKEDPSKETDREHSELPTHQRLNLHQKEKALLQLDNLEGLSEEFGSLLGASDEGLAYLSYEDSHKSAQRSKEIGNLPEAIRSLDKILRVYTPSKYAQYAKKASILLKELKQLAAERGDSKLTDLLTNQFDERYKCLVELFKGDRKSLGLALSADMPSSEQLEECLKANASPPEEDPSFNIEKLLNSFNEDSSGGINTKQIPHSDQNSIESISVQDDIPNKQQRIDFVNEIAELELNLQSQKGVPRRINGINLLNRLRLPINTSSQSSDSNELRHQPISFEGLLAGSEKSQEPEQHISTLSAEIDEFSEIESSVEVFNQPFEQISVYLSTEEDLRALHEETLVYTEADKPVFLKAPAKPQSEFTDENEPRLPKLPYKSSVSPPKEQEESEVSDVQALSHELSDTFLPVFDIQSAEKSQFDREIEGLVEEILELLLKEALDCYSEKRSANSNEDLVVLSDCILGELLTAELAVWPKAGLRSSSSLDEGIFERNSVEVSNEAAPLRELIREEEGIRTDSQAILSYVDAIFAFGARSRTHIELLLSQSLRSDPRQMLESLQSSEAIGVRNPIFSDSIIPVDLYLQLERSGEENDSDRATRSSPTSLALTEASHIHNKMIFDAINEALIDHRPYGTKGAPMPWSSETREFTAQPADLRGVIEDVKKRIKQWSAMQTGKLPGPDMLLSTGHVDEDLLQHMQEERLAACLSTEMLENDNEWVDYELEDAQVKLDLADIVLDHLVIEAFNVLQLI